MRPMLDQQVEDVNNILFPCLASYKLDGVRCLIIDGVACSRRLKPIPNKYVQALFGKQELNGLDGELMVGHPNHPDVYRKTTSGVMSFEGEPDVRIFAFDNFLCNAPFAKRLKEIPKGPRICPVRHILINSLLELEAFEAQALRLGYEGVMLRSIDGPYKQGRSTIKEGWLLKLKRFHDSEAAILGFEELMQNNNEAKTNALGLTERGHSKEGRVGKNTLGAFLVSDIHTKCEFSIGSGMTADERSRFWKDRPSLLNKIIKYKFFPSGSKDKPRFPTFLGFRDPIDF